MSEIAHLQIRDISRPSKKELQRSVMVQLCLTTVPGGYDVVGLELTESARACNIS